MGGTFGAAPIATNKQTRVSVSFFGWRWQRPTRQPIGVEPVIVRFGFATELEFGRTGTLSIHSNLQNEEIT